MIAKLLLYSNFVKFADTQLSHGIMQMSCLSELDLCEVPAVVHDQLQASTIATTQLKQGQWHCMVQTSILKFCAWPAGHAVIGL